MHWMDADGRDRQRTTASWLAPGGPAARLNFRTAHWPLGRARPSAQLTDAHLLRQARPGGQAV